jgi:DNA-binding response OmpR family regulator
MNFFPASKSFDAEPKQRHGQTSCRRVLFVDDNDDICFIVSQLLSASNYEVTTANSMADGLELALSQHFDAFILDNLFPDGTGLELCRQLRRLAPSIPILFLSAAVHESDRQAGFEAGAQAYLTKPDGIFNLADAAARILNR